MPRNTSNAVRIEHIGASIPKPTNKLLVEIASGIQIAVCKSAEALGDDCYVPWELLEDMEKACWIEGARCAYAVIAIHGGAEINKIAEPD